MGNYCLYFLLLLSCLSCRGPAVTPINNDGLLSTIADLWQTNPARVRPLLRAIYLPGSFEKALETGDTLGACRVLLDHFRSSQRDWVVTTLDSMADFATTASGLLRDTLTLAGQQEKIPSIGMNGWQWDYTGTIPDDEFGYSLNGHKYLSSLYFRHQREQDQASVHKFNQIIQDWVLKHPLPPQEDSIYLVLDTTISLDWRDIGEVEWRTLEAGNRLGASWLALFYAFQKESSFSDATRLLMLSSIHDQAEYLYRYHKTRHNWTTMEMNGLALAGLSFPEFEGADEWAQYALRVMSDEINRQVYPDGVQTEISTKTQWVALNRFESLAENFEKAGLEVSAVYHHQLEQMYNYLAYCMRPDGHQPINNDSDREDLRPRVLKAANKFHRPDWIWVATNGKQGERPDGDASRVFPWGGMYIMRNSWQADAHWAFFDIGPYGTGHQHRDKLHLSVSAYGKDFLVDGGRYTHQDYFSFDPSNWRGYFRSSFSHNVILVNGHGQKASEERAIRPLMEGQDFSRHSLYDYSCGTFTSGFEEVEGLEEHFRSVLYLRDQFWLILDQINTDRPREIQTLWHFHPQHRTILRDQAVITDEDSGPNLQIIPIGSIRWDVKMVEGRETPTKQGWYSADYGIKVPNPTIEYSAKIDGPSIFAWLIVPAKSVLPEISAQLQNYHQSVQAHIDFDSRPSMVIELPLSCSASSVKITTE